MQTCSLKRGNAPLVLSFPHVGTWLPAAIADTMTPIARHLLDTDWHVDRLYGFAERLDATVLLATHSRYVIDLNRAPDDMPLYPGADNTELCPLTTFDHEAIYLPGQQPDTLEIAERLRRYWQPYHATLTSEIGRLLERHRRILLWDGHSIRSHVPRLFDGRLPDLNFGTADGTAAHPDLLECAVRPARDHLSFSVASNGRFKGGYITRRYGKPAKGVHAIQLELSQRTYMEEELPFRWLGRDAERISRTIEESMTAALAWVAV